jgi:vacuolar-type H+-ATPase subunit F/Vma7
MARVAVIGEDVRVQGFGLAGAIVCAASGSAEVHAAWRGLSDDVAVVVLTAAAATVLAGAPPGRRLTVVMPE